ncbi:YihY/virulence factor BrkB family protein [Lacticaseibacillus zhaodongensis]|uniref:YihY/virulence factor BrkB family protein n=1 Tax=Lacticaseibacillus zhaodongensis TaxID=2668065 RepID=UPI0012D3299F|nr:YihY/virulence factor BrkB family protein [Lacticaseibacillus zhaodongensis]
MAKRSVRLRYYAHRRFDQESKLPLAKRHLSRGEKTVATVQLFFRRFADAMIDQTAAALTYYTILSLFPTALIVINLVPRFGFGFTGLRNVLNQLIPENVMATLHPVLHNLAHNSSATWLGIGAVLTLWAASLAMASVKTAYNRAYGVTKNPQNFLISRIISMFMMVIVVVAVIATMIIFTFGQQFLEWLTAELQLPHAWLSVFLTWRWPVTLGILMVALMIVDYFVPSVELHFWTILPGVFFTIAGWLLLAQVFSLYMQYFGRSFSTYGTLGAFIVLLLWLFFSSAIMILGAILNAVTSEYFFGKPVPSRGKTLERGRKLIRERRQHNAD